MISATTLPATVARFANSLPLVNIDLNRFLRSGRIENEPLQNAYKQFAATYGNWVDKRFDEEFLASAGAGIIDAFTHGEMDRHDAARALAEAWNAQLNPVRSAARKQRVLDAAMAADSLLAWLDAEISGKAHVKTQPIKATVTTKAADAEETLVLDVHIEDSEEAAAVLFADGVLDKGSYHKFLMQAQQLYQRGIRTLTLDLSDVTRVDLSGIYALHAAAKIFRGEHYPRYEYGYAGLRHMVEENLNAGVHNQVSLAAVNERVLGTLEQSGVAEVFGI